MHFSKELMEKAKTASSAEELLEMAKKEDIELSAADAETYFSFLTKGSQSLTDEELEQVAGGKGGKKKSHSRSKIPRWSASLGRLRVNLELCGNRGPVAGVL